MTSYRRDQTVCFMSMGGPEVRLCLKNGNPDDQTFPCEAWSEKGQKCQLLAIDNVSYYMMRISKILNKEVPA